MCPGCNVNNELTYHKINWKILTIKLFKIQGCLPYTRTEENDMKCNNTVVMNDLNGEVGNTVMQFQDSLDGGSW